ncbi:hypothetical protein B2G51_15285 [Leptospira santarosai]|nr:hypothetical protein B2G51_15285 [Leptospira santarosai]
MDRDCFVLYKGLRTRSYLKNRHMSSTNNNGKLRAYSHGFKTLKDPLFVMNIMTSTSMNRSRMYSGTFKMSYTPQN